MIKNSVCPLVFPVLSINVLTKTIRYKKRLLCKESNYKNVYY